jgi:glycogen debranching enzyme
MTSGGAQGWFHGDRRALSVLNLEVGGELIHIGTQTDGPTTATFHYIAPSDIRVRRERRVRPGHLTEDIDVINHSDSQLVVQVRLWASSDLAGVDAVRAGRYRPEVIPRDGLRWEDDHAWSTLHTSPAAAVTVADVVELTWHVTLNAGSTWRLTVSAESGTTRPAAFDIVPAVDIPQWTLPPMPEGLRSVAETNLADLRALLLADPLSPSDSYAAAGSPWYLTLFGRDSLWTARLLLPLGPELAAGTLRTLARRQGTKHDPETEEQPGKIPHEVRAAPIDTGQVQLSATYYGTIDATPLWVCLLHEAWRAGMPSDQVRELLPNLIAAMGWITGPDADPDGDGLLEYIASTTGGLTNQGWKDSHDGVRHADGSHPTTPLALCEVQGYAHAAALAAADLATAFGEPGAPSWIAWAQRLRDTFHSQFWIDDYPAIALDGAKTPVTGATSNMAHLLGTGILNEQQSQLIADRLAQPDLTTAFGLRTLTTTSAAYNPISYHCGSIWPHDTAIAIVGLAAEGHKEPADRLAANLIQAARHFGGRAPELYGVLDTPVAYPAACLPQAWSAAGIVRAALHLVSTFAG